MLAAKNIAIDEHRIDHALAGFAELPAHPDVTPAFQLLGEAGMPILALTNGSADNTRHLLEQVGLSEHVERIISIDEIRHWKPRREVYLHAAKIAAVPPEKLALVAAHAWDIHGASQADLVTGWVSRLEKHFDPSMNPADAAGENLLTVCQQLA